MVVRESELMILGNPDTQPVVLWRRIIQDPNHLISVASVWL